jgi:ribosomal protein S18 acetylase RimI-like enzyme
MAWLSMVSRRTDMASPWQILSRTFFWAYERGTWQYDLAVAAILVFVLATPRAWFQDQPQVGVPAAPGQVQLVKEDGRQQIYRVDARLLAPPVQTPALENDLHNALQKSLPSLRYGRFEIAKIEPERDAQGTVIAYQVEVHR